MSTSFTLSVSPIVYDGMDIARRTYQRSTLPKDCDRLPLYLHSPSRQNPNDRILSSQRAQTVVRCDMDQERGTSRELQFTGDDKDVQARELCINRTYKALDPSVVRWFNASGRSPVIPLEKK